MSQKNYSYSYYTSHTIINNNTNHFEQLKLENNNGYISGKHIKATKKNGKIDGFIEDITKEPNTILVKTKTRYPKITKYIINKKY